MPLTEFAISLICPIGWKHLENDDQPAFTEHCNHCVNCRTSYATFHCANLGN